MCATSKCDKEVEENRKTQRENYILIYSLFGFNTRCLGHATLFFNMTKLL